VAFGGKPVDDGGVGGAILETGIEFLADLFRETSDLGATFPGRCGCRVVRTGCFYQRGAGRKGSWMIDAGGGGRSSWSVVNGQLLRAARGYARPTGARLGGVSPHQRRRLGGGSIHRRKRLGRDASPYQCRRLGPHRVGTFRRDGSPNRLSGEFGGGPVVEALEVVKGVIGEAVLEQEIACVLPEAFGAEVEDAAAEFLGDIGEVVLRKIGCDVWRFGRVHDFSRFLVLTNL